MKQQACRVTALALALAAPVVHADIFWTDPYDTARSNADWGSGTGGKGALGQLESITGQTVDRSPSSSAKLPSRPAAQQQPSRASASARSDAAAMDALAAGVLVFSLLQAMDAQQDAQAKAAAEAERQRQLEAERQRQLRLQSAARQRAAWDQQDNSDLGDIFSRGTGTAFFGSGGAKAPPPVADDAGVDASAVPLRFTPPPPSPVQADVLEKGREFVRDTARDLLKKTAEESVPPQLRNSKEALKYFERANDYVGELFKAMAPESLVKALVDPDPESSQHLLATLDRIGAKAASLPFDQEEATGIKTGEVEAAARLLAGDALSADDMKSLATERVKSSLVDKLWDRFTGGGD